MSLLLTNKQTAYYTANGYLELEELIDPAECPFLFQQIELQNGSSRDLWRNSPPLKDFLLSRKMVQLMLELTGKSRLRLACDHWFSPDYFLKEPTKVKQLFSVQGITSILFLQLQPDQVQKPTKIGSLGLFPFPRAQGNALIIQADILLNWPSPMIGIYAVVYSFSTSLYIHNPADSMGTFLKSFGYGYGDPLRNDTHPLLLAR